MVPDPQPGQMLKKPFAHIVSCRLISYAFHGMHHIRPVVSEFRPVQSLERNLSFYLQPPYVRPPLFSLRKVAKAGHQWTGPWEPDVSPEYGEDGWQYAGDFRRRPRRPRTVAHGRRRLCWVPWKRARERAPRNLFGNPFCPKLNLVEGTRERINNGPSSNAH